MRIRLQRIRLAAAALLSAGCLFWIAQPPKLQATNCGVITISDSFVDYWLSPLVPVNCGVAGTALEFYDAIVAFISPVVKDSLAYPTGAFFFGWKHDATGTLSVTNGSAVITGSGTALQTFLCGSGNTAKYEGARINFTNTLGGDGQRYNFVVFIDHCVSETQVVMTAGYTWRQSAPAQSPIPDCPMGCSGLTFEMETDSPLNPVTVAYNTGQNALYYEVPVGELIAHYRTPGDTAHLANFRDWSDDLYVHPRFDKGRCRVEFLDQGNCWGPRQISFMSMCLRAHDLYQQDPVAGALMWAGLRVYRDTAMIQYYPATVPNVYDSREYAILAQGYACGAMGDPDPTEQGNWRTMITTQYAKWVAIDATLTSPILFMSSWHDSLQSFDSVCRVTVTNGSRDITLTGSGCTWPSYYFQYYDGALSGGAYRQTTGNIMFFDPPTAQPSNNTSEIYDADWQSSTTARMKVAYTGSTSSTKGFVLAGNDALDAVGYSTQPFFMAYMVDGWEAEAKALDGIDNTKRDQLRAWSDKGVAWLLTYAKTTTVGSYYFIGGNCIPPNTFTGCLVNDGHINDSLVYNIEAGGALALNYRRTGNPAIPPYLKSMRDDMLKNHAVLGVPLCDAGTYMYHYDFGCSGNGGAYTVSSIQLHKFYGQLSAGLRSFVGVFAVDIPSSRNSSAARMPSSSRN